jgi:hypothetical protein
MAGIQDDLLESEEADKKIPKIFQAKKAVAVKELSKTCQNK